MSEIRLNREDFETEAEWYTYMITHPEEEENVEDEEEYQKGIYQCLKCGYILDETDKDCKYTIEDLRTKLKGCPKCKGKKFKKITKEAKQKYEEEQEEKKKEKSKADARYIKVTLDKINRELNDIKKELLSELENNKITPEHFASLMVNLSFLVYKYYRKDDNIQLFWTSIREFSRDAAKNALEKKYEVDKLDSTLDSVLEEYDKENDLIYLMYSKKIAQDSLVNSKFEDIDEINKDIARLEQKIKVIENANEYVRKIEDKHYDSRETINENYLSETLKKYNN